RSREQLAAARAAQRRRDSEQRRAWETERLELARQQAQLRAHMAGLEQTIAQAAVVAPVSGTVVGLNVHSTGAVVQPAQTLLEIVPQDDALMVDARFPLASGEKLVAGMPADLRLTTLDSAATPVVQGRVLTVSADRLEDSRTGEPYLRVQVAVPAAERQRLAQEGIALRAGLPAEVHARLGERTLLGQMLKPVTDRLARALAG
ncbi:MAG: HlyD family efflux transporter periplasmic adaptor subunit, partial [Ideonella sp.]|nr:HlyD family efflux transporter periplasmic adaptor subunit [Ideonella sp.]